MITDHVDLITVMSGWGMSLDGLQMPLRAFGKRCKYIPGWIEFSSEGVILGLGDDNIVEVKFPLNEEEFQDAIVELIEASM